MPVQQIVQQPVRHDIQNPEIQRTVTRTELSTALQSTLHSTENQTCTSEKKTDMQILFDIIKEVKGNEKQTRNPGKCHVHRF